jgi:hypothetical protein
MADNQNSPTVNPIWNGRRRGKRWMCYLLPGEVRAMQQVTDRLRADGLPANRHAALQTLIHEFMYGLAPSLKSSIASQADEIAMCAAMLAKACAPGSRNAQLVREITKAAATIGAMLHVKPGNQIVVLPATKPAARCPA